jgi:hypothetical protein
MESKEACGGGIIVVTVKIKVESSDENADLPFSSNDTQIQWKKQCLKVGTTHEK